MLREILKQERLDPTPAAFQLAWMLAYNEGLLDAGTAPTLPEMLNRIRAALGREPLSLDAAREEWIARLKDSLERMP